MQFMFRRLRLYTARFGYLQKGKVFRAYLFGHEFMIIGDVGVMKKMMTQVMEELGWGGPFCYILNKPGCMFCNISCVIAYVFSLYQEGVLFDLPVQPVTVIMGTGIVSSRMPERHVVFVSMP